jgi:hypothetical protein
MHVHEGEQNYHRAFFLGVLLNVVFVAVELVYGHIAGSLALVADAWHNLSDVLGLLLAWGAYYAAARRPSPRFTYGLRKSTILAALGSAVLLLIALGAIAWEAIGRFVERPDVEGEIVLVVAGIGFVINTITALLFFADRKKDLNLRGAFLHMAADALVSLGVVVSGLIMMWTGWSLLDPILSLGIVLVILMGTGLDGLDWLRLASLGLQARARTRGLSPPSWPSPDGVARPQRAFGPFFGGRATPTGEGQDDGLRRPDLRWGRCAVWRWAALFACCWWGCLQLGRGEDPLRIPFDSGDVVRGDFVEESRPITEHLTYG